ncbi:MAG: hypothetical protein AB1405_03605 [Bdellovibrionota bacterium]
MIREAVDKIQELVEDKNPIVESGGRDYSIRQLHPVVPPTPKPIGLSTLAGVRDLAKKLLDQQELILVVVESGGEVAIVSQLLDDWQQRAEYGRATVENQGAPFPFGQKLDPESFIIAVHSQFADTADKGIILKLAGAITAERVVTAQDDGISQQVGVRQGITMQEKASLPSLVSLKPFRTFREVDQPESKFLFRAHQEGDGIPRLSLREADGGAWKIEAIQRVAKWLRDNCPGVEVVA